MDNRYKNGYTFKKSYWNLALYKYWLDTSKSSTTDITIDAICVYNLARLTANAYSQPAARNVGYTRSLILLAVHFR